ncbi:transcriptional regulator/sugar kinase [Caulobacter sp. AP07]|uniref:ROK family transcriptional regulator n=1 Tax=Caulobacter sp. AP07 TaxID=1144304 RepID=UPI000271F2E7|nr:ROK family transcriptional regulator [Caulobacter sp. AP07]EJL27805.1 transcriptional regulator/sugar kinase [Caulobacter sp. AP07]
MPPLEAPRKSNRKRTAGASLSGANLERVGDHNQRVILQAIRVGGPITRVALAQISGLTPPAVANITKRLLDDGLILEAGRVQGPRGQPAMNLTINPDGCLSIGVNIDRDHITVVMLDLLGAVRARASQEIEFPLPDDVARFCKTQIRKMLAAWKDRPPRLAGIGVALPDDLGRVDLPHRPENYDVWSSVDVGQLLADVLPLPVFLENDAAAAALGELQFGHGLRKPSFFYVLISSGLGGGLVVEGNYFRGAQGRSGEIGFLPVRSPKTKARSLQEVVSLSALYAHLAAGGVTVGRPDQLAGLSRKGQALVEAWIALSAKLLVQPFVGISCVVNPEAIYIGGRLPTDLIDRLVEAVNARLARLEDLPALASVERAATSADGPAVGAALLPFMDQLLPSRAALMKTSQG